MTRPIVDSKGPSRSPHGVERRSQHRKSVIEMELVPVALGRDRRAFLLDVSEGGIGVQGLPGMHLGSSVPVSFELPGSREHVEGTGIVMWTDSGGRSGVLLPDLEPAVQSKLRNWLGRPLKKVDVPPPRDSSVISREAPKFLAPSAGDLGELNYLREEMTGLELNSALSLSAERTRLMTRATGLALALSDGAGYVCRAASGNAPPIGVRVNLGSGLSGECLRTGQIVHCEDTETDPRADRQVCRRMGLRSAVLVPIHRDDAMMGVLAVFSDQPRAFVSVDVMILRRVADLIAGVARLELPTAEEKWAALPAEVPPSAQLEAAALVMPPSAAALATAMPAAPPESVSPPDVPLAEASAPAPPERLPDAEFPVEEVPSRLPAVPSSALATPTPLQRAEAEAAQASFVTGPEAPPESASYPAMPTAEASSPGAVSQPEPVAEAELPLAVTELLEEVSSWPVPEEFVEGSETAPMPGPEAEFSQELAELQAASPAAPDPAPDFAAPRIPPDFWKLFESSTAYSAPPIRIHTDPVISPEPPEAVPVTEAPPLRPATEPPTFGFPPLEPKQAAKLDAVLDVPPSLLAQPEEKSKPQLPLILVVGGLCLVVGFLFSLFSRPRAPQSTSQPPTVKQAPAQVENTTTSATRTREGKPSPNRLPRDRTSPSASAAREAEFPSEPAAAQPVLQIQPAAEKPPLSTASAPPVVPPTPQAVTPPAATALPALAPVPAASTPTLVLPASGATSTAARAESAGASPLPQSQPGASSPSGQVRSTASPRPVSQGVSGGRLLRRVEPVYPSQGRLLRLEGEVDLHATVTTIGRVDKVQVVKGNSVLAAAAVEAVKQWQYEPFSLDGRPVEREIDIIVRFSAPH